jgi:hypothetical protein
MLYRCTDDVERLQTVIGDTEQQFVDCLQQIKTLGEKDEQQRKELEDLRGPPRSWWTWWIHQKAPVACVSNALAYVKSFLPNAQLDIFAQGMAVDCTDERFEEYR